jgi:predicted O-methyltransferase YrrM
MGITILFRVIKFLKYILLSKSRRGHGIHSPFVFDLVTRVFRNKIDPDIVSAIEKVRKRLISDRRVIEVKDYGAGSLKLQTSLRKVADIARYSSVSEKYGVLLFNMAAEFGKPYVLELGTSLGISAMYMAAANRDLMIRTVEGCPAIAEIAVENFSKAGFENVEVVTGSFDEVLSLMAGNGKKPGLIYIDGNHRKEAVMKYFNIIADVSYSGLVVIFDDINYSREMDEAWGIIKRNEKVAFTVDVYRMGIVFFRAGINHNNYIIRH